MSRFPIYSQRAFLLDAIKALVTETESETTGMNLIEDCLTSLTLESMCEIVQVQGRAGYRHQGSLLNQALEVIERQLYLIGSHRLNRYWVSINETLKQPAQRLEELQARLIIHQREEVPESQRSEEDGEESFEILYINEIALLVAIPTLDRCYFDLKFMQSHEHWTIFGEYFPFEIQVGDLTFVVSSAGEIILQVKNFPDSLIQQVTETLKNIARSLYNEGKPRFRACSEELNNSSADLQNQ